MIKIKQALKNSLGTKQGVYEVLLVLFVAAILISNTVVNRVVGLPFGLVSTAAVITFIIPMWIGDIITEVYGKQKMLKAIFLGFFFNLLMVGVYTLMNILPTLSAETEAIDAAYKLALSSSFRILVASMTAYLFGTVVNAKVMLWMKGKGNNHFTVRAFLSTVVGQLLDNGIFFVLALAFVLPWEVILMIIATETLVEIVVEASILPLTNKMQKGIALLPEA